jgi:hypothetical protein
VKINVKDFAAVNVAIDAVAGKARQHVHTGPQVQRDAEALYTKLCRHLPKKLLVGTRFRLSSQPSLPKAYGNRVVIHTEVIVEVCPSGLFVVETKRCEAWASTKGGRTYALLPEAVKEHLKTVLYARVAEL